MQSTETMLAGLDSQELVAWADATIYARAKSYVDSVSELSRTEDGWLVARGSGSREYVTMVRRIGEGEFDQACTCPYDHGGPCKHVVAVLLAALVRVKRHEEIPVLQPDDELYLELADYLDGKSDDDGRCDESGEPTAVEAMLAGKSREELLEIVASLVREFPGAARWLGEREQLATGKIDQLVGTLRNEIRNLTATDYWSGYGDCFEDAPDYSSVEKRLQALLDQGHADAVFELGEELWERGNWQVESFDDDGMIASDIARSMRIVLRALPDTKLSRPEQLIWLFDRMRENAYDLLDGADELIDDARYVTADWRELAAALEAQLAKMQHSGRGHLENQYPRRYVVDQLTDAYRRAGEPEKAIPLLEKEAEPCLHYDLLVEHLLAAGETGRARSWCIEGYGKMVEQAPDMALTLQRRLRELAETEGNFALAAAYRAQDFFRYPSMSAFCELREASEKIDGWPAVREAVIGYLRSGKRSAARTGSSAWPLPEPEVGTATMPGNAGLWRFPKLDVLIGIAILEARHDNTVALFAELCRANQHNRDISEKVAESVVASHPDTAIEIWRTTVDTLIAMVKTTAYQEAMVYLRKIREVLRQTDRLAEWSAMIAELRARNKPKRNLMALLKAEEKNAAD